MTAPSILIAGYTEDVELVRSVLPKWADCQTIDQTASEQTALPTTSIVAYIFSADTASSSALLGVFSWINYWTRAPEQYIVGIGGADFKRGVFHFAEKLPKISLEELRKKLELQISP